MCVSNLPDLLWYITGRAHKIRTMSKRSLKSGNRCLLDTGSPGSSNPTSIHLKTKSISVKKKISKEDRIWTVVPGCPECKRDAFETRISKCVTNTIRHHQDEQETDGAMHWDGVLSVLKGKFRNQLEKEFTDEEASRQGSKSVKMKMEN